MIGDPRRPNARRRSAWRDAARSPPGSPTPSHYAPRRAAVKRLARIGRTLVRPPSGNAKAPADRVGRPLRVFRANKAPPASRSTSSSGRASRSPGSFVELHADEDELAFYPAFDFSTGVDAAATTMRADALRDDALEAHALGLCEDVGTAARDRLAELQARFGRRWNDPPQLSAPLLKRSAIESIGRGGCDWVNRYRGRLAAREATPYQLHRTGGARRCWCKVNVLNERRFCELAIYASNSVLRRAPRRAGDRARALHFQPSRNLRIWQSSTRCLHRRCASRYPLPTNLLTRAPAAGSS